MIFSPDQQSPYNAPGSRSVQPKRGVVACKLGPDRKIYVSGFDLDHLSCIEQPDSAALHAPLLSTPLC
ncbi:MAG: hypothetical protein IPP80_10455 [Ignavibacteria bacterium]|nr:hypothetical protein [Ignavibacteria bacterium]